MRGGNFVTATVSAEWARIAEEIQCRACLSMLVQIIAF